MSRVIRLGEEIRISNFHNNYDYDPESDCRAAAFFLLKRTHFFKSDGPGMVTIKSNDEELDIEEAFVDYFKRCNFDHPPMIRVYNWIGPTEKLRLSDHYSLFNHKTFRSEESIHNQGECHDRYIAQTPIIENSVQPECQNDALTYDLLNINNQFVSLIQSFSSCGRNLNIKAKEIIIDAIITWNSMHDFNFISEHNILFKQNAKFIHKGSGSLYFKAGIESLNNTGSIIFENKCPQIFVETQAKVFFHYHPEAKLDEPNSHKYQNPYGYYNHVHPSSAQKSFMLVNNVQDLQEISFALDENYALSRDINASDTINWNNHTGFKPIAHKKNLHKNDEEFTGIFDGNNFKISDLYMDRSNREYAGIFGVIKGYDRFRAAVENLKLENIQIKGEIYVGAIAGLAQHANFKNIEFLNKCNITGKDIVGGIIGTGQYLDFKEIKSSPNINTTNGNWKGIYFGSAKGAVIHDSKEFCDYLDQQQDMIHCYGHINELHWG